MAKHRRPSYSQLGWGDQYVELLCPSCGFEYEEPMGLLSSLVSTRRSMEREYSDVLCGPSSKGSSWPRSRAERRKRVARGQAKKHKGKSSKG